MSVTITKRSHAPAGMGAQGHTYTAGFKRIVAGDTDFMEEEVAEDDFLAQDEQLRKTYAAPTNYVTLLADQAADLARNSESYQQYQNKLKGIAQKAQEAWVEEQLDGEVPEEESLMKLKELLAILHDAGISTDLDILLDPDVQAAQAQAKAQGK